MICIRAEDITRIESEAGVLASLVYHPEFSFYSENLLPNHFFNKENRYIYTAICCLALRGVNHIDSYSILEALKSNENTAQFAEELPIDVLNDFIDNSENLARHTLEGYKLCVDNVMNAAFRRDTLQSLKRCEAMCFNESIAYVWMGAMCPLMDTHCHQRMLCIYSNHIPSFCGYKSFGNTLPISPTPPSTIFLLLYPAIPR